MGKIKPITKKQYWCSLVEAQIYLMGVNYPREYYSKFVLPKKPIKTLKEFWHRYKDIELKRDFDLHNVGFHTPHVNWELVREINGKVNLEKRKLIKELLDER